ncbi:DUF7263 family protein [Haloplanus rubicundus]|uniref:Uncharacterized protein n=1 Tax=Haloplanus rubicundus TaxID=1547898 RepID=A0A345EB06_9EURY|nr:hypothetical protein [Haloplanus rubicundus]AXG09378.1 hypothetical protein DU484_05550 [Haloplanus rubicundus]
MRAQTNLVALVLALVLVTGATVVGVGVADGALAGADRDPLDRHAATSVADRLVAPDSPTSVWANALDAAAVEALNASRVEALAPPAEGAALRITLDGEAVAERGNPVGGVTVRRSVTVVSRSESVRRVVNLSRGSTVRVPRGIGRATVAVDSGENTTVRTVRADGRVVLYDGAGLDANATVHLSRYEPTTVRTGAGANATGRVVVTYRRPSVETHTLAVTVDA